ncbi:MAG: hypothetical protein AB1384_07885 [Actinomycetota bacterium]
MKRTARITVLLALVFFLMAAMTTTVLAKKPPPDPTGGGGADITVQANEAGWVTSGTWQLENYTADGGSYILVANDAGASATYTFIKDLKVKSQKIDVYASKYWLSGDVQVRIDGVLVATVSLDTVGGVKMAPFSAPLFGQLIYSGTFSNTNSNHTVTLTAVGSGGPGIVNIGGIDYNLSGLHFVNVQYIHTYP